MKKSLRRFLASTKPLSIIARRRKKAKLHKRFQAWKSSGSCLPMPHLGKQFVIQEYFERFSPDIFVETGTYEGDMVDAMLGNFKKIYSVELNETYFRNAYREFGRHRNVHIFQGQSEKILPEILKNISDSCSFGLMPTGQGGIPQKVNYKHR